MKKLSTILCTLTLLFGAVGGVSSVKAGNSYLEITTNSVKPNAWEWAIWYQLSTPLEAGETYVLTMDAKCSEVFSIGFWPFNTAEGGKTTYTGYTIGTDWSICKCEFTPEDNLNRLSWNFGGLNGTLCFDNVKLVKKGDTTNLIEGGDFESGIHANWGNDGWNSPEYSISTVRGTPKKYLKMTTNEVKANAWEWAVWYKLDTPLESGKTYVLSMKTKCSEAYTMPFWPYKKEGKTLYTGYGIGTEWGVCSCTFTANDDLDYLKWCFGSLNGTVWIDDMSLVEQGQSTNLINGGDFEDGLASNWGDDGWNKPDYGVVIECPVIEDYSLEFDDYGKATTDKKYLTATGGLSYNEETGVLSSNGAEGTLVLELEDPVDLKYLNTFEVKRSGSDNIVNRLKFYEEDGTEINTWNNARLHNSGLDNNATNAFLNHNPVKKLVWQSDAAAEKEGLSLTINSIEWTLKTVSCAKAGETMINTLAYQKMDGNSTSPSWNMDVTTSLYYGSNTGNAAVSYADVTEYDEIRIYRDENIGFRAFFINADGTNVNNVNPQNDATKWNAEGKYWSIDLSKVEKYGDIVALQGIKSSSYDANDVVKKIVVYKKPTANIPQYILSGSGMLLAETEAALADATATCIDATAVKANSSSEKGRMLLTSANPNCLFLGKTENGYLANTQNVIYDNTCANLVLIDGHPFKATADFTATAATYTTTLNATAKAGTLCLPFAATIPEGVTAYTLTYSGGDEATATDVETTIPANTPVLLNGSGEKTFAGADVDIVADAANVSGAMIGVFETTIVPQNSYVLQYGAEGLGFYKVATNDIVAAPLRAYLTAQAGARLGISFASETTGISTVGNEGLRNDNAFYDLQGRQVSQPQKGLYIVNGKKVIIK